MVHECISPLLIPVSFRRGVIQTGSIIRNIFSAIKCNSIKECACVQVHDSIRKIKTYLDPELLISDAFSIGLNTRCMELYRTHLRY